MSGLMLGAPAPAPWACAFVAAFRLGSNEGLIVATHGAPMDESGLNAIEHEILEVSENTAADLGIPLPDGDVRGLRVWEGQLNYVGGGYDSQNGDYFDTDALWKGTWRELRQDEMQAVVAGTWVP